MPLDLYSENFHIPQCQRIDNFIQCKLNYKIIHKTLRNVQEYIRNNAQSTIEMLSRPVKEGCTLNQKSQIIVCHICKKMSLTPQDQATLDFLSGL